MNRALQFLVLISVLIISFSHNSEAQKRSNRDIDETLMTEDLSRIGFGTEQTLH